MANTSELLNRSFIINVALKNFRKINFEAGSDDDNREFFKAGYEAIRKYPSATTKQLRPIDLLDYDSNVYEAFYTIDRISKRETNGNNITSAILQLETALEIINTINR